jgi:hypothetical protein
MTDQNERAEQPNEDKVVQPREENGPDESEIARGNVHSHEGEDPGLPTPPPGPH